MVSFTVTKRAPLVILILLLAIFSFILLIPRKHVDRIPGSHALGALGAGYLRSGTTQGVNPASIVVPPWNRPPSQHVAEATPLFIGFTRNWPVLKQAVVSYITAGWPPSDIYVVDNTGTMMSNELNKLTSDNPFYLDHEYLTRTLHVNVLTAPTLLSFAQLQNFFLYTSVQRHWSQYFWSHMDVAVLSAELYSPFASLYLRAVDELREAHRTDSSWGIRFFAYDHLTLANTAAYLAVGGFDTFIPYYMTDCDYHFRLAQAGFTIKDVRAGIVYDIGESLLDLGLFSRENSTEALDTCEQEDIDATVEDGVIDTSTDKIAYGRGDCRFHGLRRLLSDLDRKKQTHEGGRNFWQIAQNGGKGEPFWMPPDGFERALEMHIEHGKAVFDKKWNHPGCDLKKAGNSCKDAWSCTAWRVKEG